MRSIPLVIVAAAAAALGAESCTLRPSPPAPPLGPRAHGEPSAPRRKEAAAPGATFSAAKEAASGIKVLGAVGDIAVVSYPPTGFEKLKPEERLLAYHLAQAALAGDPIFTLQTSREALPVTRIAARLLARRDKLDPAFRDKLIEYRFKLFIHHGLHDARTGQKLLPLFSQEEIEAAARGLSIALPKELLAAMFDPKLSPTGTHKAPGPGEKELLRVAGHLEAAIPVAPAHQKEALRQLVRYFKTGAPAASYQHDFTWLKQVFPVEYIFGISDTAEGVRARKGAFLGLVAIADEERSPPLQALSFSAQYFEQKMPWDPRWKRAVFRVPAAAAVTVLAATGAAGPMTFMGKSLPSAHALRENYGAKSFVLLSVADSHDALIRDKAVDEFAPAEARAELHRCSRPLDYAATSLHEVTGHGSGKVSPALAAEPEKLLAPYYATLEEGRAELVADYLSGDPKTVELGLLPDAGCARIYPQYRAMNQLLAERWAPNGDAEEDDRLRADRIAFGYLKDKGVVSVETRGDKTFFVIKDPDAWQRGTGELLAEHQRIKATGDKVALKALIERYVNRKTPRLQDEVLARLSASKLPLGIAMIPPMLTPVRDASGAVVDATAAQTTELAAYIEALEKASLP